jgi:folate-binding protein YgfZ
VVAATETAALAGEYATLTERCGLVDRSERGKLALTGAGAVEFLNGQVTNELVGLKPGEGCYAAFLTHKGKMLGDLRILVVGGRPDNVSSATDNMPTELLLDTERSALQALFDMIRRFKVGYEVELHKRTLERSLLSLVGPRAAEVAGEAFDIAVSPISDPPSRGANSDPSSYGADSDPPSPGAGPAELPAGEHGHLLAHLDRTPVRLIRTDTGIDVLFDAEAATTVSAALEHAGATRVSEAAAEIVRVERGRPRFGVDIDETTIPQEAGLNERAVSFTKGCYVGQETVARLYYKGKPNRHLRGLRLSEPSEPGAALLLGERPVGSLGSSVVSPTLGPIGLALVRREAEPGATVSIGAQGAEATVVELPFR